MSEFDAMMMTLWLASLVMAGASGMTVLLRLALAARFLLKAASRRMADLNSRRAQRLSTVRPSVGVMMRLAPAPCD